MDARAGPGVGGLDRIDRRPKRFSSLPRDGVSSGAAFDAPPGDAGRGLRAAVLIGGCAAAAPAVITQAAGYSALPDSARLAVLAASVGAAAVMVGAGLWALSPRVGREPREAFDAQPEIPRPGLSLQAALFGSETVEARKLAAPGTPPLEILRALQSAAVEGVASVASAPSRDADCAARPPRAAPAIAASVVPSETPAAISTRVSTEIPSDTASARPWSARGVGGRAGRPGAGAAKAETVEARQSKLVWTIAEMSKSETARRRAEEAGRRRAGAAGAAARQVA